MIPKGDRKCALYRVVNRENGKDYVGISVRPTIRWKQHITEARSGRCRTLFANALRKYGAEAFDWRIIAWASCFKGGQALERLARAVGLGAYNLTQGGEGMVGYQWSGSSRDKAHRSRIGKVPANKGTKASPETRKRISESGKGRVISVERRQQISEYMKARMRNCPPLPEETRQKIRQTLTGRPGKKHTEETKARISATKRRKFLAGAYPKYIRTAETQSKMNAARKGKPGWRHTTESKAKISATKLRLSAEKKKKRVEST